MKRTAITSFALLALLVTPAAWAQTAPKPKPAQAPPALGKVAIATEGGQRTKNFRYVARGAKVRVVGRVRPFVPGQVATVKTFRGGKVVERRTVPIRLGKRRTGTVSVAIKLRRKGLVRLRIGHKPTAEQQAFRSKDAKVKAIAPQAGEGAGGINVLLLQRGLRRMGFAVPVSGSYDSATSRAVTAFRKTNDMARNGYGSRKVFSLVLRGKGAFRVRYPQAGRHVEFDWSRQVLAIIDGGKARNVYHSSSGTSATPTVFGKFQFYRKQPGTNSLGMVHSNYFIGGYAIHGYHSVPNYPASHGCLRVPIPNALEIDRQIKIGQTIFVYR